MTAELAVIALSMPILFALHNLEEIAIFDYFMRKNRTKILQRLPKKAALCIAPVLKSAGSAGFTLAVTVLFVVLAAISYFALWQDNHIAWLVWLAATVVFTFQLVVHIITAIYWRGYAFGTITAVLCLPAFIWMIARFMQIKPFALTEVIIASIIVGVVTYAGGIPLLYARLMRKFEARFGNAKEGYSDGE